jgi:hypothetical protein
MACVYSAIAILLFLVRGPKAFVHNGVTLVSTIVVYAIGGILGGLILGLLRPLTRYLFGVLLIAIPVSAPLFGGILVATRGVPWEWSRKTWITFAICTCFFGPFFGFINWRQNRKSKS